MSYGFVARNGQIEMTLDQDYTVLPDIVMSLSIRQGSWFVRPDFGHRLHTLGKNTANSVALAKSYIEEALKWLLDAGKISSLEVEVEADANDSYRLNYLVRATQTDGNVVTWSWFKEVL